MKTAILILAFTCANAAAFAQNKGLDLSFGNKGIAPTNIYTDTVFRTPTGLILQPDGKILFSGRFIARYKSNGMPDSSFATNGFFLPPFSLTNTFRFSPNAIGIALQSDGKILSVGKPNGDTGCSFMLRLLPDGKIDSSFGRNGISKNNRIDASGMLLQLDGKSLIFGRGCGNVGYPEDSFVIGRYLTDGALDTAFGSKGFAHTNMGHYPGSIAGIGLLSDGRIEMGGIGYDSSGARKTIVIRYMPDGSPDISLGGTGRIFPFYSTYCHGFTVFPDGSMLLLRMRPVPSASHRSAQVARLTLHSEMADLKGLRV